ncbi:alpha-ketoglutarate-dependent dioxygenase AlkB [Cylindrospermopsis raciborskii Cr2010]|uniref:alpha-ketoglutarate-dependent dioxygenase AlkB family protein n=1 Tax=Cylindrospermopsis raciborskii TaxID=77022 RepID=UPI000E1F4BA4|nr:alpha-ketoglutarate-dependent dioxygenase AlkB [Cylindrospermopsis raciborskii]TPX27686.1 alpha-ketoglutarate-dependent dioxygenase AlkB [Cylindrospermopsis raciborskii GIHE 2018]UJL33083.1 alpha-ketoglutarate-dependent dioxygenase AlkB [Cylindrospermopsis raciborskii Cr2010]UJS05580.1 alpha-ketoglutarate-dependent dioxygenase AlkB [Cylindrospermopsis raciborskii KLL07]
MYHNHHLTEKNLFEHKVIIATDGNVILYPEFFSVEQSNQLFCELYGNIKWKQEIIHLFGKKMPIPRLTAWYGDEGKSYTYSGIEQHPESWNPTLKFIKSKIEEIVPVRFNSVLINLYRDGKDSMGWHSDDEPELGKNPLIASLSFGATRRFYLRHKYDKSQKTVIDLENGSLLLMQDQTQHFWQHQVGKTAKKVQSRINLTFRIVN